MSVDGLYGGSKSSEGFAVEDAALGDLEAEGLVDLLGEFVGELGVRRHFEAALGAGPLFGSAEEGRAYALAAV